MIFYFYFIYLIIKAISRHILHAKRLHWDRWEFMWRVTDLPFAGDVAPMRFRREVAHKRSHALAWNQLLDFVIFFSFLFIFFFCWINSCCYYYENFEILKCNIKKEHFVCELWTMTTLYLLLPPTFNFFSLLRLLGEREMPSRFLEFTDMLSFI